ncbi:MAG: GNAT family N-acetyltransferase, partial [Pseudomonadota bacterium]
MSDAKHVLKQGTLSMRPFQPEDLHDFSALHSDPDVMTDLGGPIALSDAQAKLERYIKTFDRHGYGRFAVFERDQFAGYVGVMHRANPDHPLGAHDEIGWRLNRAYWG